MASSKFLVVLALFFTCLSLNSADYRNKPWEQSTVAAIRDAMAASNAVGTPTSKLTMWGCRNAAVDKWNRNHQRKRRLLQFGLRADTVKGAKPYRHVTV
ncbi:unnamed protein product [Brassica oleracea var. botrytis]